MSALFTPVPWFHSCNLYEVNVRQYTPEGTFMAFAKHLPRLAAMGVQVLWFMPITPISRAGRKGTLGSYYACSDYTSVNPEFGTVEDFRKLVQQAHELGMKVILDWVANHTGLDHVWSTTHPEFYKKNGEGKFYDTHGWDDVIDLNYYDGAMRQAMIDAMQFWVTNCNIDGFRCDMAHLVMLDFWRQARQALDAKKPLFWLAETEDLHYLAVFDCCYAWRWMHLTEKFSKGQAALKDLVELLTAYDKEFPAYTLPLFFSSNHDENSWNGTEYEKYGDAAQPLAVLSYTWDGVPLVYSGQELPNKKRLMFFDKDQILWNGQPGLHDFYRAMATLRKEHPAFTDSNIKPQWLPTTNNEQVLAYIRRKENKQVLVLLNLSAQPATLQLPEGYTAGSFTSIFDGTLRGLAPQATLELKAWDYWVLTD